ncbi:MAG: DnaJ domain-containing protein, partial [Anaerolineae bacterium]
MKDYYAILEVPPTASQETIREQYLLLIQAWHPDKFPNPAQKTKAEEKCKQINAAYDILKDAEKRAQYDRDVRGKSTGSREETWRAQEPAPPRPAERPRPTRERPEPAHHETEAERLAREEEWIRIYFEQARRRQSGRPAPAATGTVRALIVADGADLRSQIRSLLSSDTEIRVVGEASNGLEAVQQFDAWTPDVMITGISVPNLGSLAAAEAVRRKHPLAKIIVVSVPSSSEYIRQAAMAGVCDYLTKPASAGELQYAV